jgi:hypothetical protein
MSARRQLLARGPLTAALSLLLLGSFGSVATAEIPQTTTEWLALFNHRRNNTYSVKLECTWQSLVNGELDNEWNQIVQLDDFGGKRIDELGRERRHSPPSNERSMVDSVYAFDGNEYRELAKVWRVPAGAALTLLRKAELRQQQPASMSGWIEGEPGELATINDVLTPFKLGDYWFAMCLSRAAEEQLEPRIESVAGRPDLWEVVLESDNQSLGHKCRAIVNAAHDARVELIDLWHDGRVMQTCKATHMRDLARWRIATGTLVAHIDPQSGGSVREREFRVVVRKAVFSGPSAGDVVALPEFSLGTAITDQRTGASYRVGTDANVDKGVSELAVEGRQRLADLKESRSAYGRWPTQFRLTIQGAVLGAVVGLIALRLSSPMRWPSLSSCHNPGFSASTQFLGLS